MMTLLGSPGRCPVRPHPRFPVFLATVAALLPATFMPLSAQIATDRPDFVESSATVGAGALQVETSLAWARTESEGAATSAWSSPTLLRFGFSRNWELRLESDGWTRDEFVPAGASTTEVSPRHGMADLAFGLKWHVLDEAGTRPAAALLLHADLPWGSPHLQGEGLRPSLRVVTEWGLPSGFALGLMPGVALDRDGSGAFLHGIMGAVLGKELTGTLRSFVEVAFGALAPERHGGHDGTVNAGLALLLSPTLQLDTGFSLGLTSAAPTHQWTVGFSALRPGGR